MYKSLYTGKRSLLSLATAIALVSSGVSLAQEESDESAADEIEEIVVTGTRLQKSSFEQTTPNIVIDADYIAQGGFVNTADAINSLPLVTPSGTSLAESSGSNVGQTFADLYGLGSQRTLTLINGRRSVSGNAPTAFGASAGSQVDLNTLPTALIERIDIISANGAPVYGSDAIAGTINVIMKKDFEGFEVDFSSGVAEGENDGWEHRLGLTAGANFDGGRGNISVGYEYNKTDAVLGNDRQFLRDYYYDFENPDYDADDPSTGTRFFYAQGRSIPIVTRTGIPGPASGPLGGTPLYALGLNIIQDASGTPVQFGPDGRLTAMNIGQATGNLINFVGGDGLLLQDYDSIRAPIERHMVNMFANYEISDNLRANAELNFYNGSSSDPNRQPFYQSGLFGGDSATLVLPIDYPFLAEEDRQLLLDNLGADATEFGFHKAMDDLSQSGKTEGSTDMLRLVLGLEGEFTTIAGREVRWDVSWNRGESRSKTNNTQLVEENYREALDLEVDASGEIVCSSGNSECVPLNILGIVTDQSVIDYVTLQGYENSKITQRVITANAATDLVELPGGDWQVAVGYENREEAGNYQPDYFLANGLGRTAALEALNGRFDTEEFYVETRLPLIAEDFLPIVSAFDLEGAWRTVDHSSAGTGEVYNIGVRLALDVPQFGNITFRANDTESVRSPAIAEAFLPRAETFSFANDPCDFRYVDSGEESGGRAALCAQEAAALGYSDYDPTTFQSTIVNASQQGFTGGNPDLINETSESESMGVVITPNFVEGLTFSVDLIDVYLEDAIETLGLSGIMAGCYDGGNLSAPACGQFSRDPSTFQINGFQVGFVNAGYRILKGYQSEVDWAFDFADTIPGQFRLRANVFDLDTSAVSVTGDDAGDTKGLIGNSSLRANVNLMYMLDEWTFNWRTQYISSARKSNTAPERTYDIPELDEYFMHTLFVRYSMNSQVDASIAIRNITDEDVPYGLNSFSAIGAYDLIGTYVQGSFQYRF